MVLYYIGLSCLSINRYRRSPGELHSEFKTLGTNQFRKEVTSTLLLRPINKNVII